MIVVDANVMASALLGESLPLLVDVAARTLVVAPDAQFAETRRVLNRPGRADADAQVAELMQIIQPIDVEAFEALEAEARTRLHKDRQSGWPVLATALVLDAAIWSNDRDFFGAGVPVWSSWNMRHAASDWSDHD